MQHQSPEHYVLEQLRGKQFYRIHDALKLFAAPSKVDSTLTIAGDILRLYSKNGLTVCDETLWIEPELDSVASESESESESGSPQATGDNVVILLPHAGDANAAIKGCGSCSVVKAQAAISNEGQQQAYKSTRMWPLAPKVAMQETVETLHREFLETPTSHFEATQQWLKPSVIIDDSQLREKIKDFPQVVLVLLDNVDVERFKQWNWFQVGKVALIHRRDSRPTLLMSGGKDEDLCSLLKARNRCFSLFYDWLDRVRSTPAFADLGVYAGFEIGTQTRVRLWGAFTQNVDPLTLVTVASFYDLFRAQYADQIQQAVGGGWLQVFWNKTASLNAHKDIDGPRVFDLFRDYIGWHERGWPLGVSDEQVEAALKGMCGTTARLQNSNGDYQLTILGAFFMLLGAIASKFGGDSWSLIKSVTDIDDNDKDSLWGDIMPFQEPEIARQASELLFNIFLGVIEHKTDQRQRLAICKVTLRPQYLELDLKFDPFPLSKQVTVALRRLFIGGKPALSMNSQKPGTTSANEVDVHPADTLLTWPKGHCGEVSRSIAELFHLLHIYQSRRGDEPLFPQGGLELREAKCGNESHTILRFNLCKTS